MYGAELLFAERVVLIIYRLNQIYVLKFVQLSIISKV